MLLNASVTHLAATQHVSSLGMRPKLSVSFLRCRISRMKLLEYQYYSTLDKMAALEPLTLQHLTVSTSASFPFPCHPVFVSFPYHLHFLASVQYEVTVLPPLSPTHSPHTHHAPITKAFVTRLKKQLFVESLVQGSMTVQVRLSACSVVWRGGGGGVGGEERREGRR